jgi:hypothetical protein
LNNLRIELLDCGFGEAIIAHLPLADHVHQFDANQDDASTPEILEAHHWFDDAFDGAVILLHDVIQVLVLADLDRCRTLGVERFERGRIGAALSWTWPPTRSFKSIRARPASNYGER